MEFKRIVKKLLGDRGFLYWLAILILYGAVLATIGGYTYPSIFFHFLLLSYPVGLIVFGKISPNMLGIKKGNPREGFYWIGILAIALLVGTVFGLSS